MHWANDALWQCSRMDLPDDLGARARHVMDTNRYLTLGTTEPDHQPRLSPVYFTHVDYRDFYWLSSPAARHSLNVAARPAIAIVIFDSSAPIGQGQAVYLSAHASPIPDDELPQRCAELVARVEPAAQRYFTPEALSGDTPLRLYRARATSYELHIPGRDPLYGTGIDSRHPVTP